MGVLPFTSSPDFPKIKCIVQCLGTGGLLANHNLYYYAPRRHGLPKGPSPGFLCGYITDILHQRTLALVHCGSFLVVPGKIVPIHQAHTQVSGGLCICFQAIFSSKEVVSIVWNTPMVVHGPGSSFHFVLPHAVIWRSLNLSMLVTIHFSPLACEFYVQTINLTFEKHRAYNQYIVWLWWHAREDLG
jgi:hypothetical protein